VRGPLIWLGQQDPVASTEWLRAEDPVLFNLRLLLTSGWLKPQQPYRVRDIVARAQEIDDFRELLERVAGDGRGEISNKRLGKWLKSMTGRVVDGHRLVDYGTKQHAVQYFIERVER
jgi:hypothetical protein